ncbi:isopeptide-forming domain-containing fimbrial protein [Marinicella rhabdoformis]|uniref:isopeptide-forming domain-containing fimbrial protein n=1 Tax=Marinicella rhabdoformis TaxID=2580566 RepID=UPI0012AEBA3C|nr:isopeptide-forming domain-containing fimbrial protein [Marinicella rhabdoformis]
MRFISGILFLFLGFCTWGQVPVVSPIGGLSDFPGADVCTTVSLNNTGATGYGPYFQITIPSDVAVDTVTLFGGGVTVTAVGSFPAAPGNQLTDPVTGDSVSGNEGDVLYIIQPPIGSVVSGGPPLDFDICFSIDANAPVNIAIPVSVTPVYQFGDTPTGDNGPITGATQSFNVTPILVVFEKTNNAPEGERPPGQDWPVGFTLTAHVASGNTIDNLVINDLLPPGFVLQPPVNVTGGVGCVTTTSNPIVVNCAAVNGTSGDDLVIEYSGYFADILDEMVCDVQTRTNSATLNGEHNSNPIPEETTTSDVVVEHVSIQKGASPGLASPGETVVFTVNVQISEYATVNDLQLTDTIPDGYTYQGNFTSSIIGIAAVPTVNADGSTTLAIDATAAGNIAGGNPQIIFTYEATIDQTYNNSSPVLASDSLTNTLMSVYDLTGGASACAEGSSATVAIRPITISKEIVNPQASYQPGETVTYRLTMMVPSGDTSSIVFTDFLPLPVFDVSSIDIANFGVGFDIRLSPLDTMGLTPVSMIATGATNSLEITWPDVDTLTNQIISVDIDVDVSSEPFADNLSLSNLFQGSTENTINVSSVAVTPVLFQVRAPELVITKGVLSADQGIISPLPANLPVDGDVVDVDANDLVRFQITVENVGGAPAHQVNITDVTPAGFSSCILNTVVDGTGTPLTFTGSIATGLLLDNSLAANDDNPVGGGAPYGPDTAIVTVDCALAATAEFGQTYTNTASVNYRAQPGATPFPTISDVAMVTVASPSIDKSRVSISPNVDGNNGTATVGETIVYQVVITLPEGQGSSAQLVDRLDNGLTFESFDSIVASSANVTTAPNNFATILSGATGINTRDAVFDFGTVTNNGNTGETITVTYTVLVNDVLPAIQNGRNKNNDVDFNTSLTTDSDSAQNTTIREPALSVNKSVTPTNADAGDTVTYTVIVTNTGTSPAYDVTLTDPMSDPDLTLIATTVTSSAGPATVTTGNSLGDTTIQVDVPSIAVGGAVTVQFDALISAGVLSGDTVNNTASAEFSSLPGNDPNERAYGPVDGSATVNISAAQIVKVVLPATSNEQSDGTVVLGNDPTLVDLTIGEEVTFRITATLAEGVSPDVVITDTLPGNATGQMEVVSANLISTGTLVATNPAPTANIGPANVVSFDFGSVTNAPDGVVNDDDRIVIEVRAVVADAAVNAGTETLTNNVLIQYSSGLDVSGSADVEVVEPLMTVTKTGSVTTADAGDIITYTVVVSNSSPVSSARAFEVTLSDTLPAGLIYNGNLSFDGGEAPDGGTLMHNAGVISASWTDFPLNAVSTISYDLIVENTVTPEQVIANTVDINWSSMPGDPAEERDGMTSNNHQVTITASGLEKTVFNTSVLTTGTAISGPEDDVTIGEEVTYRIRATLPEGTTPNAMMVDQLPNTVAIMDVVSSQIISIGNITGPGISVGLAGSVSDTLPTDGYNDVVTWNLGDLTNSPDGVSNGNDQIVFEVVAVVVDEAVNQTLIDNVTNNATFTSDGGSATANVDIDIVEPVVTVNKETVPNSITADAGDQLTYRLTIDHAANSTADAFNISVTDVLPNPGTSWINDATVMGSCSNIFVDSSNDPTIAFTIDPLTLSADSCTIEYQVQVDLLVNPNETYQNTATLSYSTAPGNGAEIRDSSDMDQTTFMTPDPAIMKVTANSSLSDTGDNQYDMLLPDLAIGETIDFTLTVIFPEGTTTNGVVQDLLPVAADGGLLEVVGATVDSIGSLTTTLPGTPVFSDRDADANGINDTVTFDFGTVTNVPNGVVNVNDQLTITVTARVVDDPLNVDGLLLTNNATFTFGANTVLNDSADIEVVEPNLGLAKSFGQVNNLVVPITLTLNNTGGTAAAYDLVLEDVFDTNVWDVAGFSAVTIPAGYLFNDVAGPGAFEHTVSISSNGAMTAPDNSIEPNEVLVFTFNATLRGDVVLPTTIDNTATLTEASSLPGDDPNERELGPVIGSDQLLLPELEVDKSAALLIDADVSTNVSPGDTLRYTLVITNSGDAVATLVDLTDIPDPNGALVVGSVTTTQGTVNTGNTGGDTTVAINIGTVAVGAMITITYDVNINNPLATGVEELVNQALLSSQELPDEESNDPDTGPDDDPTIVPVFAAPDLAVTKDDGGVTVIPGNDVTYTVNYDNVGNQDATGVVITETVPLYTTYNPGANTDAWVCLPDNSSGSTCTLAIGDIDVGDNGSVGFTVTVDDALPDGVDTLNNSVSIADDGTNGPDPDLNNNQDNDNTPVNAAPDLTLTKDDGGATVVPGGIVVFTLSYENVGNQTATGVEITETVPLSTTFESGSSSVGWLCVPDGSAGNTCTLAIADLDPNDTGSVNFAVQIDNPIPSGLTQIVNTGSIADDGTNGPDPTPGDNSDNDTTPVGGAPDMAISKSDGVSIVSPGDTLTYVLNYQNIGNQDATGVVITETVPLQSTFLPGASTAGWNCVPSNNAGSICTLAVGAVVGSGGSGSVNFAVLLDDPLDANTNQISNTVSIADDGTNGPDPDTSNNMDDDIDGVGGASIDLVVLKTDQNTTTIPGGTVIYDITYSNEGNIGSTGVVITETVPQHGTFNPGASSGAWVCSPDNNAGSSCTFNVGALAGGGATTVIQFAVTVDNPLPSGVEQLVNTVSIGDDGTNGPDLNPDNNTANDVTPVNAAPDLSVVKTHQQSPVTPGDVIVYDIVYENIGNQDATGVVLTETVPVHTTFDSTNSSAGWTCVPDGTAGSTCTYDVAAVLAVNDGPQNLQYAVMVLDTLNSSKEEIVNLISITDDGTNGPDPDLSNNNDDEQTIVTAAPDLYVTKTDGEINASPGDTVVYTIDYGNQGNQNATGVEIIETVPDNSMFNQTASSVTWSCLPDNSAGSTCIYVHGNLDAGDSNQITFSVDINDPLPAGVNEMVNIVLIQDDGTNGPDPETNNNTDNEVTPLTLEPPVGIKIGEFDGVDDRLIRWTFWWFNPNNNRELPTFIYDEIPAGTTFAGNATCTPYGTSTCTQPVFNAGLNRIELSAMIGEDEGAPIDATPDQLNNPIVISFDVRIQGSGSNRFENQARAHWDHDNDGTPDDDIIGGQDPVDTDYPLTPEVGDPTTLGRTFPVPALNVWAVLIMVLSMGVVAKRRFRT